MAMTRISTEFAPARVSLHLDSDETTEFASGSPTAMDSKSEAVHEIGHLLGLGHSSVEEAVMFPTILVEMELKERKNEWKWGQEMKERKNGNGEGGVIWEREEGKRMKDGKGKIVFSYEIVVDD